MTGNSGSLRKRTNVKQKESKNQNKKEKKDTKAPDSVLPLFVTSGLVVVFAVFYYLYVYRANGGVETFVSVSANVSKVVHLVPCSKDYISEKFKDCKPKKCGRVVMDSIVTEYEANRLRSLAEKGIALAGGGAGGASILDLHSGAVSKGEAFVNIYRLMEQSGENIFTEEDFNLYRNVKSKIQEAIATEFKVKKEKLYLTKPTFFSRFTMKEAKIPHDEYWHTHIDKETYGSFHYTSLLYLGNYKQEFTGGRFIFVDKDTNRTVEPKQGRVSFFTSGSENVHYVEKLQSGIRYAITIAFTCDQTKAISDPVFQKSKT